MPPKKGRKRVQRPRIVYGDGFFGDLWSGVKKIAVPVHDFVKKHKLVSKGLALTGNPAWSNAASALGYGRKRRPRRAAGGRRKVMVVSSPFTPL